MALFPGQAGRILLGCLAIAVVRLIYRYVRIVEIIIAFFVLAQLAAYLIPRFTLTKSERPSAIFPEAASTSTFESNHPGPNKSSRRQDGIQMHLRRPDMAAVATASSSNNAGHIGPDTRSSGLPQSPGGAIHRRPSYNGNNTGLDTRQNGAPQSPGGAIHRRPSYEGNNTGLDTRPNGAPRRQGEEIQKHLQRLAMAAASADAGVANVSPSLLYRGEGVNIQLSERTGSTMATTTFTRSSSDKLHWQLTREHRFDDTEHFSYSTSPNSSFTGY